MSAYVVVEATVKDASARDVYAARVKGVLQRHGGELVAFGPWRALFGEPAFVNGMVIQFPSSEAAMAWYHDPEYQAAIEVRNEGLDCRFRLVG